MNATPQCLRNELAEYRRVREQTLGLVANLTQEDSDWSPSPGKWSIGEVLDHLLLAERFFRRDLERLAEGSRTEQQMHIQHTFCDLNIGLPLVPRTLMPLLGLPFTFATFLIPTAVLNFMAGSRLFPMRHPSVAEPRPERPVEALRQELGDAGRQTTELLGRFSPSDGARMTVSHPLLGTRNIPQLIRFVVQHEQRHQGQIADLKQGLTATAGSRSVP